MTQEQKQFIVNILSKLQINPAAEDAMANVQMIQSIIKELTKEEIKK